MGNDLDRHFAHEVSNGVTVGRVHIEADEVSKAG